MTEKTISVKIRVRKVAYLFIPLWIVQGYFGFKIWAPKFLFQVEKQSNGNH